MASRILPVLSSYPSRAVYLGACFALSLPAFGQVAITSPVASSTSISEVHIAASIPSDSTGVHLEVWDNGNKLGNVPTNSFSAVYVLPSGKHTLTVNDVSASGTVLAGSSVNYTVAENCTTSPGTSLCDMDQLPIDTAQIADDLALGCSSPPQEAEWTGNANEQTNGCQGGIQGQNGSVPAAISAEQINESGVLGDVGNLTLNGHSLHLSETQGTGGYSNVLFKADNPVSEAPTTSDAHWTLDEYVHLPNPIAHQAFEVDTQYVANGVWTKFYTECQFNTTGTANTDDTTGYWAVFDNNTGGWFVLNGKVQNNQTPPPPAIPCSREQFAEPWAYSASPAPAFSGWHHIVWTFLRNSDGTVTFETLTFDGTPNTINYRPTSSQISDGGNVNFSALVQLDGSANTTGAYDTVDAYVDEINVTHTP